MSVSSVYEQKNLSLISVRITEVMFPMVPRWQGLNINAKCGTSSTKRDLSYEISLTALLARTYHFLPVFLGFF